jgi:hypothetical protein
MRLNTTADLARSKHTGDSILLADYLVGGSGDTLLDTTIAIPDDAFTKIVLELVPLDNSKFVYRPKDDLHAHLEVDLAFQANNTHANALNSGDVFTSVELINMTLVDPSARFKPDFFPVHKCSTRFNSRPT